MGCKEEKRKKERNPRSGRREKKQTFRKRRIKKEKREMGSAEKERGGYKDGEGEEEKVK